MRGRSYSYSPSPPRGYGRRRSPSPRGRYGDRDRDLPTSLLVRNLCHDCRPEDLRGQFGQFGPLKDIYLPRDFHTGEPRGFGFVQYIDPADAADAKHHMDGGILLGLELTVVFAQENRKEPAEMRARERIRGRFYDRGRSPVRYSRSPYHRRSYSVSPVYYSPSPRHRRYARQAAPLVFLASVLTAAFLLSCYRMGCTIFIAIISIYDRSISPRDRRYRDLSYSRSPYRSRSQSRTPSRSQSRSLEYSR